MTFVFVLMTALTANLVKAETLTTSMVLKNYKCAQHIPAFPPQMAWLKNLTRAGQNTYKGLNAETDHWTILTRLDNGFSELWVEKNGSVRRTKFDLNCKKTEENFKASRFQNQNADAIARNKSFDQLTDKVFDAMVKAPKLSLVYVWSPEMVYSCRFHNDFKKSAKNFNLRFVSVVESSIPTSLVKKSLLGCKIADRPFALLSNELFLRGALEHMPMTYLVGKGKVWGTPLIGAMGSAQVDLILKDKLAATL